MREIKFRRPMLREGKFCFFKYWGKDIEHATFIAPGQSPSYVALEDQQLTNLRDKNGKDIYEGDIISYSNRLYEVRMNFNGYYLQRYKLWRGKFVPAFQYSLSVITKPSRDRFGGKVENAEVVGNICEHPELLKFPQS